MSGGAVITNSDGFFHEDDKGNLRQVDIDEAKDLVAFHNVIPLTEEEELEIQAHLATGNFTIIAAPDFEEDK